MNLQKTEGQPVNNEFDFGFSFEDSDLTDKPVLDNSNEDVLSKLQALEEKMEQLTLGDTTHLIEQHKELVTSEVRGKLQQVEQLILPLLYNLQKNPEKEYIHWPNRKEIIQKQIEKILQVTRYYEK